MRKKIAVSALIVAAAVFAAWGCGKKETEPSSSAVETEAETEEESEESEEEEPIRPENLGEIRLGDYKGIEVETEEPYIVTDEEVDGAIGRVLKALGEMGVTLRS